MIRTLALALGTALIALTGCGDRGVPCEKLCSRARSCQTAVGEALTARLPSQSKALRQAGRELRQDLLPDLLENCPERCARLRRSGWWRTQLRPCQKQPDCTGFARCFAPALEP